MHSSQKPPGGNPRWSVRRMVDRLADAISPDPLIGKEFDGYKIEDRIGRGGMSSIYRAMTASGEKAAIKVLNEEYSRAKKAAGHFLNESTVIESISHPNMVRGLGHGKIDANRLYLAMEYLECIDLDTALGCQGRLPPDIGMRILLDVCRGLEAVHSAGIIHRDIKPSNVMLAAAGAKIIDFGICRSIHLREEEAWDGTIYGTINYVAPEQTRGENRDQRSDIYSLGVSAYRMMCGALPIQSDDIRRLIRLIREMVPRVPSGQAPGIPGEVDRIIMKALRKSPDERFQSAGEMAAAIESYLSG